jgi:hypothetical protein
MRTRSGSGFTTIRTEGGLVPPELLARIAAGDSELEGIDSASYHLAAGERRNEAINRSWSRLIGAWAMFKNELAAIPHDDAATGLTRQRWTLVLFQELGYGQLQPERAVELDGRTFPVSHAWYSVPIHLVGAHIDLDRRTEGVAGAARTTPHGLVQELLNASDEQLWGFVSNGFQLRLLRDNVSLTRQAFVEFDLEGMFDGEVYADFVVLWLLCHQSRFEGDPPEKCILERWVADAAQRGTRALDQLRDGVETAIKALGSGFLAHPQNSTLRERLGTGALSTHDYYRQLLRLVYRLLFLFVAEDRDLLLNPSADVTTRERYVRFYSIARLRSLAARRKGGPHGDAWDNLRLVCRALGRDDGEPRLGLPGLGSFLWSDRALADLDASELANEPLYSALRALTTVRDGKLTRMVDYRNLGSEELGGIYESLLELHPEINADTGAFSLRIAAGHERKTTGSYYTPTSLINELLDSALEPVLDEAASQPDAEAAMLALTVLDPACGSGHFLIAAAHRIARRLAAVRTGDAEPSPETLRRALRDVVGTCVHGVDVNEMAVELCKVSLWMEAVEPGKPFSFLEHRIVCGNALLGVTPRLLDEGVPNDAFRPITGDDKEVIKSCKRSNKQALTERAGQLTLDLTSGQLAKPLADVIAALDAIGDDERADIEAKERLWAEQAESSEVERARLAADAWCAAFVAKKVNSAKVITDRTVRAIATRPESVEPEFVSEIRRLREEYRFLHPHLAFPNVFRIPHDGEEPDNEATGWSGGFSVVVGNPPWERVKLQGQEFFGARAPQIAEAANAASRNRMIKSLREDDPALFDAFEAAVRQAEGASHLLRNSGRYPLCGRGDVNTYAVFAESMRDSLAPTGRLGVVVPTGIATDATTQFFFRDLVATQSLWSLYDFFEVRKVFRGTDDGKPFCLLTVSGSDVTSRSPSFAFSLLDTADLRIPDRVYVLDPQELALLNPNTRTCPIFRTRRDAELTVSIYEQLPIIDLEGEPDGNPWGITFQRMIEMANDSALFRTAEQLDTAGWRLEGDLFSRDGEQYLPLYEAKMLNHFDYRFGDYRGVRLDTGKQIRELPTPTIEQHQESAFEVLGRYWVSRAEVETRLAGRWDHPWLLAFRDVTEASDTRTMIASPIPLAGVGHNAPLIQTKTAPAVLAALLSSFVFDYLARQKLAGNHMTYFIFRQLPLPVPSRLEESQVWLGESMRSFVELRTLELVYTSWKMAPFARELGNAGPPFLWDEERRSLLRAELDAACFHLYGIKCEDVEYIMEAFPIVKRKDEAAHDEYLTKRLILERYNSIAEAVKTGAPYQTILAPPPADPILCHPESSRPAWAISV